MSLGISFPYLLSKGNSILNFGFFMFIAGAIASILEMSLEAFSIDNYEFSIAYIKEGIDIKSESKIRS